MVAADEERTLVTYCARTTDTGDRGEWDSVPVSNVADDAVIIVTFTSSCAHLFGPPNDEAFAGHPLYAKGLRPYSAAEVRTSSWIRSLERMNAVHPSHRPESFRRYRHFILAFHDTTFECVAESFDVQLHRGTPLSALIAGLSKFDPLAWRHGER